MLVKRRQRQSGRVRGCEGAASVACEAPATPVTATNIGGEVSVFGTWTGAEQDSFLAMVKPWSDATGVKVNYTGTA